MKGKNFVSATTAAALKRLLSVSESPAARAGRTGGRGHEFSLVKCTSDEAVGGSDIGNQCYPAVVLLPRSNQTEPEQLGNVWLTVLGESGVVAPQEDMPYTAVVSGETTLGNETRHRVFAAESSSGNAGEWVKVTGDVSEDTYPGVLSTRDPLNLAVSDGATVRVVGGNGEALANGTRYLGTLVGHDDDGVALYDVTTKGNLSNQTITAVTNVACASGNITKTTTTWTITGRDLTIT